jgi:hypothetical protein
MRNRDIIGSWIVGILLAVVLFSCSENVTTNSPSDNCSYSDADSIYVCDGTEFHIY